MLHLELEVDHRSLDFLGLPNYRVDENGNVWGWFRNMRWKILSPAVTKKSYRRLGLVNENGTKTFVFIHILVLLAFVGPCPEGTQCRHLDGDGGNNKLNNLCWGTPKENAADQLRHGTQHRGERTGSHKLTEKEVVDLRELKKRGWSNRRLGVKYGVSSTTIFKIVHGEYWAHVPVVTDYGVENE